MAEEVLPFSHGTAFLSPSRPDYWEYNCIRIERPIDAEGAIAATDVLLADCRHRLIEWAIPMEEEVVVAFRQRGWMADPLVYMLHDGRAVSDTREGLVDVDYAAVRELRDLWHREDFDDHQESETFYTQARAVAELASVRVLAAMEEDRPLGYAQVHTHDGGSEIMEVYVHPERRGAGLGTALTARAIRIAAAMARDVWICAERDGRPRRLYERLGFGEVAETGSAILPPPEQAH